MARNKKGLQRQLKDATEKAIKRHKRDASDLNKADFESDKRYVSRSIAASTAGHSKNMEETSHEEDTEMTGSNNAAGATKRHSKKNAKENRFIFKILPKILSVAFPVGFCDDSADSSIADSNTSDAVASAAALERRVFLPNAARVLAFSTHIFQTALSVKRNNLQLFPVNGNLMLAADQDAFLELVSQLLPFNLNAGGLTRVRYQPSNFVLERILDNLATARMNFRDADMEEQSGYTSKLSAFIQSVDEWIDSFGDGAFQLQALVVKTFGAMKLPLRPANE